MPNIIPEKIKILIAEDHVYYRKVIVEDLKNYNIRTTGEASTGLELLEEVKTKIFDVILLDLRMPDMEGDEALDIILNKFPETKIIILSMYDDASLMEDFLLRGAYGYLPKSHASPEILNEAIREVKKSNKYFGYYDPKTKQFNRREAEIIPLLCEGKTSKEIGSELSISAKTVEGHRNSIYKKTNTSNVASFIKHATTKGLDLMIRLNKSKEKK